jgi:hypothetical protein
MAVEVGYDEIRNPVAFQIAYCDAVWLRPTSWKQGELTKLSPSLAQQNPDTVATPSPYDVGDIVSVQIGYRQIIRGKVVDASRFPS